MWTASSRRLLVAVCLLTLCGCGGLYPVQGTVTLDNGTPLSQGMVVFENVDGTTMGRGTLQSDGSFQLSTQNPNDGLKPGRYKVLINPMDMSDVPDEQKKLPFDVKYTRFQTSGLEVEIKAEPNQVPLKLTRPARPAGKK